MNKKKWFLLVVILCVLSVSVPTFAADSPDANEVLRRFVKARENLTSFIGECESKIEFNDPHLDRVGEQYSKTEYRFDGTKSRHRLYLWGNVDIYSPNVSKDQAHYTNHIYDGETFYEYSRPFQSDPGHVILTRGKDPGGIPKEWTYLIHNGLFGEMMGYHRGDNGKRIDEILAGAKHLEMRQEKLRGVDCYVIDAAVKEYGKYTIWIDPTHDYHIAKIHVQRSENDFYHTRRIPEGASSDDIFEVLGYQKIEDSWFPLEYGIRSEILAYGELLIEEKTTKITSIVLDPDHDALQSFIPNDIQNGAIAHIIGFPHSVEFVWQDGKVVDDKGNVIMDCMPEKQTKK